MKKKKGISWRLVYFTSMMVWLEYYFRLEIYDFDGIDSAYPFLLSGAIGAVMSILTLPFKKTGNAVLAYFITIIVTIYYIAQMVYYKIFGIFFGLTAITGAGNAMDFKSEIFRVIRNNIPFVVGMLVPVFILVLMGIYIVSFERPAIKHGITAILITAILMTGSVLSVNFGGKGAFSPYSLMHDAFVIDISVNKLGVPMTAIRDFAVILFGDGTLYDEEFNYAHVNPGDRDDKGYKAQIDENIDLEGLYENATDEDIKSITAYVSNQVPTYENEYTGMFDNYNLIYITAESLVPYMVREEWTPTLYKIMNEGFVFDNYYVPTWHKSTIDAEHAGCLSQYPSASRWSLYDSAETYQPYALGNALNGLGYTSLAYHDYDAEFYDRSKTHPNMGYNFRAIGNGLCLPSQDEYYSDLETIQTVYEEFAQEEPFNVYFMTYSGHLPYNYVENPVSAKNREKAEALTEGMPYNDTIRAYVAAQLELEYALEYLVNELSEDGLLDNTLFVITPDHMPYVMKNGDYDIFAQENVIDDVFKLYHSCFGIWNSKMKEPIHIDKICSNIDVLPTVLNLMGVNYDSRILMGRDALYDEKGSASFSDYSYIGDDICYDTSKRKLIYSDIESESEQNKMIYDIMNTTAQKYYISDLIIEADYFEYIYGDEYEP